MSQQDNVQETVKNNQNHVASCTCGYCINNADKFRDLLIDKLLNYLNGLKDIYKKLLGVISAILSSLVVVILLQISFHVDFLNTIWYSNIFSFIRAIPVEIIIILGFLFASTAALISEWAEIILLILVGSISAYWSFTNRQWFAFAAALFMLLYSVVRTNMFNKSLDVYILSFFKHSLIVIVTLLAVNFILKMTKM